MDPNEQIEDEYSDIDVVNIEPFSDDIDDVCALGVAIYMFLLFHLC